MCNTNTFLMKKTLEPFYMTESPENLTFPRIWNKGHFYLTWELAIIILND